MLHGNSNLVLYLVLVLPNYVCNFENMSFPVPIHVRVLQNLCFNYTSQFLNPMFAAKPSLLSSATSPISIATTAFASLFSSPLFISISPPAFPFSSPPYPNSSFHNHPYSLSNYTHYMPYSSKSNNSYNPYYRAYRKRVNKRLRLANKPVLDQALFDQALSQLPARFKAPDLYSLIALQHDPLVCLELFRWASKLPRFHHTPNTYHITLQKLAPAGFMDEMYEVVDQLLVLPPHFGTQPLFNMIIYYFTRARKLARAITVFKHMKKSHSSDCRPSITTYNLLFSAFLSRGTNTYINHVYMGTMESLFRQLLLDGIKPDILSLNSVIQGYVLSNHVNHALNVFHQMSTIYGCNPNAVTYDHLIHGLCVQSRTNNAGDLFNQMKEKGFLPSSKTYNSLVNALALAGQLDDASKFLLEMAENQIATDFITYKTLLNELCRKGRTSRALSLLQQFQEKGLVDNPTYIDLSHIIRCDYTNSNNDLHRQKRSS